MSSPIRTTNRSPASRTTKFKLVMPPGSGSAATGPRQQGRLSAFVFGSMIIASHLTCLPCRIEVESVVRPPLPEGEVESRRRARPGEGLSPLRRSLPAPSVPRPAPSPLPLSRFGRGVHRLDAMWEFVVFCRAGYQSGSILPQGSLEFDEHRPPRLRRDRHHRRRRGRLLRRLSPDADGQARRRARRAGAALLRHDLACRRARRPAARAPEHDAARAALDRALFAPRGRDRPCHRLEAVRLDHRRAHARAHDAAAPGRRLRDGAGRPLRRHIGQGGGRALSDHGDQRPPRRVMASERRQGEPGRRDAGAGEGRPHARREASSRGPRSRASA